MRVTHVTNSMENGPGGFISGNDRHILYLAPAQKARGMSVSVILDLPGPMVDACHKQGIPVAKAEGLKLRPGMTEPDEETVQGLIEQFKSFNTELIHCHNNIAAVHAVPAANRLRIPCILTGHDAGDHLYLMARRMGLRFAIICLSKPRFHSLKKLGIPETDLYYVPHGTDTISPAYSRDASQSSTPNLIFVGNLMHYKGPDIAILAITELRRRRAASCPVLNIYGQGDAEQYLREMVTAIDLNDTVLFHGYVHNILASCDSTDILIVPSRHETGPLVVLEAMSRGMPVVTSDVGDVRAMLPDRRYGRIVPARSAGMRAGTGMPGITLAGCGIIEFADAIESLLVDIADGQIDPDLLRRRHRELYTTEKMAEHTEAVYKNVLNNSHTR
jgi:glycosyltransferase involved in cell wall biosynthesis